MGEQPIRGDSWGARWVGPATPPAPRSAQDAGDDHDASEQARREIAERDAKLRAHRATLEAGADPADKAQI